MQRPIHDNLDEWMDASIRGKLDDRQSRDLKQHLADCGECLAKTCQTETLEHALAVFDAEDLFPERFNERAMNTFHASMARTKALLGTPRDPHIRILLRAGVATLFFAMLAVRLIDLRLVETTPGWRRGVSAFSQVFLRQPSYDAAPPTLNTDETLFVAFHQLSAFYAGMAIWLLGALLVSVLIMSTWRRHMLRPTR